MLVVTRKWSWQQPPSGRVQVNRALPDGARCLYVFNQLPVADAVFGTLVDITAAGAPSAGVGARGTFLAHTTTSEITELDMVERLVTADGHLTIVLGYEKRDVTNRSSLAFNPATTTLANRCSSHLPLSDAKVYWDYGGATEGTTRLSVSGLTVTGYHVWAFTVGARGMEIWQDGLRVATNAATPTRTANSAFFRLGGAGTTNTDLANYYFFFTHRQQLPYALLQEIGRNPYGILVEPVPARFISVPVVATAARPLIDGDLAHARLVGGALVA